MGQLVCLKKLKRKKPKFFNPKSHDLRPGGVINLFSLP